jgi:hypothetical protein
MPPLPRSSADGSFGNIERPRSMFASAQGANSN